MAYSKELEEIIEAALADGVLTDKERSVLHKKALLEGVDPDELDVVIEGRLAKMKKQEDWLRPAPPTNLANEKHGNVKKCPNCGAPIAAGSAFCKECGYTFTNVAANKTVSSFFETIQKEMTKKQDRDTRNEIINSLITNFPVPTTKDDIMEFLYMSVPNSKKKGNFFTLYPFIGGMVSTFAALVLLALLSSNEYHDFGETLSMVLVAGWWVPLVVGGIMGHVMNAKAKDLADNNARSSAWKSKSEQVIAKAKVALIGDPDMVKIEAFEKQLKK